MIRTRFLHDFFIWHYIAHCIIIFKAFISLLQRFVVFHTMRKALHARSSLLQESSNEKLMFLLQFWPIRNALLVFFLLLQNEFLNEKKKDLKANECIVICDFTENYAFVIQNVLEQ